MVPRTLRVPFSKVSSCAYSTSGTYKYPLTLNSVFSETNKTRVQQELSRLPSSYVPREDAATGRRSAVLVPLCFVGGEPSVLFTLRSSQMKNHRGEVSFPGGMEDEADGGDPIKTALREAREELAIPQENVQVWGTLPQLPSRIKGRVVTTPVLAFCDVKVTDLKPDASEVEEYFHRTLSSLCDPRNVSSTQFRTDTPRFDGSTAGKKRVFSKGYSIPVFTPLEDEPYEHKIWGLTAIILHQTLKSLLTKDLYKFEVPFIS